MVIVDIKPTTREGTDADSPRIEDANSGMPVVPGTDDGKIVPQAEKRVFPETNNRTFCDDIYAPACPRGEILECHNGNWVCIGPATGGGGGIIVTPKENLPSE